MLVDDVVIELDVSQRYTPAARTRARYVPLSPNYLGVLSRAKGVLRAAAFERAGAGLAASWHGFDSEFLALERAADVRWSIPR